LYEQGGLDAGGAEVLASTIAIAVQVFRTLTEFMQGPCLGNQAAVSRSRVWDVVAGFLAFFAQCQDATGTSAMQLELKRDAQLMLSELVVMLLALLEGTELHSTPAMRLVSVLHENQPHVRSMLTHFSILTRMLTAAAHQAFVTLDRNGDGQISREEFRTALKQQRQLEEEDIDLLLEQTDLNKDNMIDYAEFTHHFLQPTVSSGFNVVVMLTQLQQLVSGTPAEAQLLSFLTPGSAGYLLRRHFREELGLVEIVGIGGRIERVYFRISPEDLARWKSQHLRESKERFFNSVERDNATIKHMQFVDFCEDMIFEMRHTAEVMGDAHRSLRQEAEETLRVAENEQIRALGDDVDTAAKLEHTKRSRSRMWRASGNSVTTLLARGQEPMRWLTMLLTVIINCILLCYSVSPGRQQPQLAPAYLHRMLFVCGALQVLGGLGQWLSFFALKMPVIVFRHEKEVNRRLRSLDTGWLGPGNRRWLSLRAWRRWWHQFALESEDFPLLHHDQDAREYARRQAEIQGEVGDLVLPTVVEGGTRMAGVDLRYATWAAGLVLFNGSFLYRLTYVVLGVLALLLNPFLFCWHLLDIALQNAILLNVLRSVVHNGRQLLFTVAFTACIIYIYTIVAFNFFRIFYQSDDRNMCDDMLTCFVYNLNMGLRSGGGIGDGLNSAIGTEYELYRIIFDISFFFIIIVILLAIVQVGGS
jgi:Ca2+-binding EF-hand superfamily protein